MAVRISTLAEIKTLSLASFLRDKGVDPQTGSINDVTSAIEEFRSALAQGDPELLQARKNAIWGNTGQPLFKTVGIARQVRVDEDYGTQNIYGIGSPTRPRIVPNNYTVNVTAERLQLDTRNLFDFMSSPDFWYSDEVQKTIGIDDFLLYTYFFVKSKEDPDKRYEIYALLPRSSSRAYSSGDVMVAHNVTLTGFKYSYEMLFFDMQNLIDESLTVTA